MSLLMLVLLPSLLMAGILVPFLLPAAWRVRLEEALRHYALTLLVFASVALGVWMLPISVDLSRMDEWVGVTRDLSVCLAGTFSAIAVRSASWPVVLFFGGNLVWMALTLGLLFVDAQVRLCASFLLDDQHVAGTGLVAYAVASGVWLLAWASRRAEAKD